MTTLTDMPPQRTSRFPTTTTSALVTVNSAFFKASSFSWGTARNRVTVVDYPGSRRRAAA